MAKIIWILFFFMAEHELLQNVDRILMLKGIGLERIERALEVYETVLNPRLCDGGEI